VLINLFTNPNPVYSLYMWQYIFDREQHFSFFIFRSGLHVTGLEKVCCDPIMKWTSRCNTVYLQLHLASCVLDWILNQSSLRLRARNWIQWTWVEVSLMLRGQTLSFTLAGTYCNCVRNRWACVHLGHLDHHKASTYTEWLVHVGFVHASGSARLSGHSCLVWESNPVWHRQGGG
jgi:hypothetical protein